MAGRPRIHASPTERSQAAATRRLEAGERRLTVWLSRPAVEALLKLRGKYATDREAVEAALVRAK